MAKRNRKIRENNVASSAEVVNQEQVAPEVTAEPVNTVETSNDQEPNYVADPVVGDAADLVPEAESAGETSQDVPETVEEPTEDGGTEEQVTGSEESSEDVGESDLNEQVEGESQTSEETKTEEPAPATVGRKSAIKEDSMLKVLFTENPQRKGTYSHAYNEKLMAEQNLTAGKAINELGIPRHHLLYLSKEGKIEVVNG